MARSPNSSVPTIAFALAVLCLFASSAVLPSEVLVDDDRSAQVLQLPGTGAIQVNVTDNVGRPIANATVTLNGTIAGLTNESGKLVISDIAPNETGSPYSLKVSRTGYEDKDPVDVVVAESETTNVTLSLRGGDILGTVLSSSGPISGATVAIAALGYSAQVSDLDGTYALKGVPGGTHSVTASAPGYVSQSRDILLPVGGSALGIFVLASLNGSISGHVYHATTLGPLNNTNVSIQVGALTITVQSDTEGSYNITNVPEGTYTLTASKDGYVSNSTSGVEVTRGNKTFGVDLFLEEKPTRLYGVVRSGTLLLVGVNVTLQNTSFYGISGPDGTYEIRNLTAGIYVIEIVLAGYAPMTIPNVIIAPGGETQQNINLTGLPGATLRGIVKDAATNEPLPNVLVTVVDAGTQPRSVFTNIYGEFEFPALAAGNYTLRFEKSGYRPMEIENVEAAEGSTQVLEFQITKLRKGFEGFIFGFDMAHSMMILALFMTIVILAMAVYLRIRTFQAPESTPAIYDEAEEEKKPEDAENKDDQRPSNGNAS